MADEHTNCEAFTRSGDDRCKRTARFTAYNPRGNPASEGFVLRFCTQHWNSHSLVGWKLWPTP